MSIVICLWFWLDATVDILYKDTICKISILWMPLQFGNQMILRPSAKRNIRLRRCLSARSAVPWVRKYDGTIMVESCVADDAANEGVESDNTVVQDNTLSIRYLSWKGFTGWGRGEVWSDWMGLVKRSETFWSRNRSPQR